MDMSYHDAEEDFCTPFKQGFLCPFCMQDLGDLAILHAHVKKYHPKSVRADHSLNHIKGELSELT